MTKYEWEWKSEEGLKIWREIMFTVVSSGGDITNSLPKFVQHADQLIQHENCFPDSFVILSWLGYIYSTAALVLAKDLTLSNELMEKAQKSAELASKYVVNGSLKDPVYDQETNAMLLKNYYKSLLIQGMKGLIQKNYETSVTAFRNAVSGWPQEALPRIRLAWAEMNIEGKSIDDINRILKDLDYADTLLPNSSFENKADEDSAKSEIHYVRGACHFLLDENDKAAIYLEESLKLNPQMDLAEKLLKKISQNRNVGGPTSEPQKKSGGCFIATAVYGSPSAPEVITLQRFRDNILIKSPLGTQIIKMYYSVSPHIARYLEERSALRNIMRTVFIDPLVRGVRIFDAFCNTCGRKGR